MPRPTVATTSRGTSTPAALPAHCAAPSHVILTRQRDRRREGGVTETGDGGGESEGGVTETGDGGRQETGDGDR